MVIVDSYLTGRLPTLPSNDVAVIPEEMCDPNRRVRVKELQKVAAKLNLPHSRKMVYELIKQGRLPAPVKEGRDYVWLAADVRRWVEQQMRSASQVVG